jgi:hypothetical protein
MWAKGCSSRQFTMEYIDEFKGYDNVYELAKIKKSIEELKLYRYPYQNSSIILEFFLSNSKSTEDSQNNACRDLESILKSNYPYQLTQNIVNGFRFFDMVEYYANKFPKEVFEYAKKREGSSDTLEVNQSPYSSIDTLYTELDDIISDNPIYFHRSRRLFHLAIIFYIDRFGIEGIDKNILKILLAFSFNSRFYYLSMRDLHINNTAIYKYFSNITNANPDEINNGLFPLIENSLNPMNFKHSIDTSVLFNQHPREKVSARSKPLLDRIINLINQ